MMQFLAILIDTWRLIRARKLFWIALVITLLVGLAYASLGYNDRGLSLFFLLDIPNEALAKGTPGAAETSFTAFYVVTEWWTTFFGMILALITCSSIFPEFMAPGSIDTLLSKSISRPQLFLAKFVSGLLFAAVQVALLAVIAFLAIRWRLGFWHLPVFWSVPLGIIFFSYLYAICVFLGVWTRSTLAALMLTLIVWAGCKSVGFAEGVAAALSKTSAASTLGADGKGSKIASAAYSIIHGIRFVLPKTSETTQLVERSVMRETDKAYKREKDREDAIQANMELNRMFGQKPEPVSSVRERVENDMEAMEGLRQSPAYIIGTSLLFEALVLGLGCWIFSRRDY
jgi:ABC-type transport system involved in multi-copper enzyme maturation permease subunit